MVRKKMSIEREREREITKEKEREREREREREDVSVCRKNQRTHVCLDLQEHVFFS
jgi:hypothetical protein